MKVKYRKDHASPEEKTREGGKGRPYIFRRWNTSLKKEKKGCVSHSRLGIVFCDIHGNSHKEKGSQSGGEKDQGIGVSENHLPEYPHTSLFSRPQSRKGGFSAKQKTHEEVRQFVNKGGEEIPDRKEGSSSYNTGEKEKKGKDKYCFSFHISYYGIHVSGTEVVLKTPGEWRSCNKRLNLLDKLHKIWYNTS